MKRHRVTITVAAAGIMPFALPNMAEAATLAR
jgi:hypothetical protein